MPKNVSKSPLLAKYGDRMAKAVVNSAAAPVDYGVQRVPHGITNGIAKLVECTFGKVADGKKNAGELYFRAAAVIVEPQSVFVRNVEVPCVGLQTSIMEMLCDTTTMGGKTTTLEEHVASIENEMKKLGATEEMITGCNGALDEVAATLKEAGPYIRFSTSVRKPMQAGGEEGVWENWYGTKGLESYQGTDVSGVVDNSGTSSDVGDADNADSFDDTGTTTEDTEQADDAIDEALRKALDGDSDAQQELKDLAIAAGHSEEAIDSPEATWEDVANMAKNPATETTADEPETPWVPAKGEVYLYQPIDGKTKKPKIDAKKKPVLIEVEVTGVDKKGETVALVNSTDKKTTYKGIKWAELKSAGE